MPRAAFVIEMENPSLSRERDEMREAHDVQNALASEEAWEAALPGGSGYVGPRVSGGDQHGE